MNKHNGFEPRDLVIHFRDLVLYVALRWRSILLVALACAVLFGGFAYWQDTKQYASTSENHQAIIHADPDAEGLARVATVQNYRAAYASLCAYNQSAPMMHIDFMAVHTRRMSYLITGDNYVLTGDNAYAAATLYSKSLASQDLYADLGEQDKDVLPAYVAELLSVKLTHENTQTPVKSVFLDIEIVAPTKALCNQLADLTRDTVSDLVGPVTESVGNHTGKWVFNRYTVTGSEAVRTHQLESLKQQKQLQIDLAAAEGALTAADRAYLSRLEKQEVEPTPGAAQPKPNLSVKSVVLGFLIGFALMVLWYALRYLFCGRVLSENDLVARHGVTVFGTLGGERKRCFVDRALCRVWQDEDTDPDLLARQVVLSAENAGLTTVYVMGGLPDTFAEELSENNISVVTGDNPADSGKDMDGLATADGLLLAVRAGVTRHADLARALALAKTLDCPVLGAVIQK